MGFYESVRAFCLGHDMIREGDRIIAGVSGGADSVCLFLFLKRLRGEIPFTLSVLHVEHGIRGEESRADARFVTELCAESNVPCKVVPVNAPAYAKEQGLSLEEAARDLRYRAFYTARQEALAGAEDGRVRIAVAHNRNDQAETVLFHLIRGSSIKGLNGMDPVQNELIRPLLAVQRGQIEAYLNAQGVSFRNDGTNEDEAYARNKIRHTVLPALEEINAGAVPHIAAAADDLAQVQAYLTEETERAKEAILERGGHLLIKREEFYRTSPFLRQRVLYDALCEVCGSRRDITREHVAALSGLMENQSGRQLSLPCDVNAQRIYQGIRLVRLRTGVKRMTGGKREEELSTLFTQRIFPTREAGDIPKKKYTKWFDYDKIGNDLQIRTRRSGDYLVVDGSGAKKSLKKYFIDEKIPGEERGAVPLLCDGSHVLWVVGYRVSAYYKVTAGTKQVLEVIFTGGDEQ